jgi:hypothetical protein
MRKEHQNPGRIFVTTTKNYPGGLKLKTIVHPSVKLVEYIVALKLALYQPQIKYLERLSDTLTVRDRCKTLTNLYRETLEELDPRTVADFFRESPWQAQDIG